MLWEDFPSPRMSAFITPLPMGDTAGLVFHLAVVILVRRGAPSRSPEHCLGMCE